ncbi:hypothetical protein ALQ04_01162 [Pseudomonas cichorii]|uniref:Uncharacterized protein n=1 Tax=Pseudomonas cichorii TaxID=36746 RepID=A0A3M4LQ55_PSECI|nr:Gfo/Idh/MocA family oxidoreductase [Pseudomonas cichorii]RMQ43344.1 hypothetical protein ALQ04_01162 [Pseudomonas cichorii]
MSQKRLRVGVIGADTQASWAGLAHIPAIKAQGTLELAAVATRREESAREAAQVFGAERWYGDPYELIRDETIDIVTVTVKVPAHRELVLAALAANKAVYCESPLGATVAESEEMAAAARSAHTAIGLQGRFNPSVRRAAQIIASGKIGRPLSARVFATTFGFGPQTVSAYEYFDKAASGANLLTISTGHVLDLVESVLGRITEIEARTRLLWPEVEITDLGTSTQREVADHVDLIAETSSGAVFCAQVAAGIAQEDARFLFEIRGSQGWLRLEGGHPAGVQAGDLVLTSSAEFEPVDEPVATGGWEGAAINIGEVYASLARDVISGSFTTPGLEAAAHNSRLIAAVERSAKSGIRERLSSDNRTL